MKNRKAIISSFGNASVIKVTEDAIPEPQPGEALIKIEASTVSATDIFIRKGIYPLLKQKPPFTLGYDFAGTVIKTAANVTNVKTDDKVCGIVMTGGNADFICTDASALTIVPPDADAAIAACFALSGITAYQMFTHIAAVKKQQKILVHGGSGAVGNILLQLGKWMECEIVSTASANKHAMIKSFYATALDYHATSYFEKLALHAGDGFDAVFDFTNQKSFNHSFRLLKKGGTLVTYAVFSSALKIEKKTTINFIQFGLDFGIMMLKLAVWNALPNGKSAAFYGSTDFTKANPQRHQKDMDALFNLLHKRIIKPHIHTIFSLENVQQAHVLLQSGEVHGQVVIRN